MLNPDSSRGATDAPHEYVAIFAARHPVEIWCSYIELIAAGCPMSAMSPTATEFRSAAK
jgi:hypothetical protein